MNENKRTMRELVAELENQLVARGQSPNAVSQYHYIFQVFLAYFNSYHELYFSKELMETCLREHYGIDEQPILSRRQHYKKKVIRASRMIEDLSEGRAFSDRYTLSCAPLLTDNFSEGISSFTAHLHDIQRSRKTIDLYQDYISKFLSFVQQSGKCCLRELTVEDIHAYIATLTDKPKNTVKFVIGPVRIFLRYIYLNEFIEQDLSPFVESVKTRTQTKIPSIWEKEEVLKLLAAIDRGNPSGKRDYAIILLVARLGIRIGDVNKLKFENIDWDKKCINFVQSKTHHPVCLPLLKDVGWAIIDYVRNGRPNIDSPYIFLTHIPPFKNYSDGNHLHATITKYLQLTDIQDQHKKRRGMHSLRHTLANRLQENREPLHTISSTLGHSSPDSASVYIKTDIELLRECCLNPSEVEI